MDQRFLPVFGRPQKNGNVVGNKKSGVITSHTLHTLADVSFFPLEVPKDHVPQIPQSASPPDFAWDPPTHFHRMDSIPERAGTPREQSEGVRRGNANIRGTSLVSIGLAIAVATRLEAIALRLEAIALRLDAIALRLDAIALRLEAIALRLEAIALRLEAIALRL